MDSSRLDKMMTEKGISNIRMGIAVNTTDAMVGRWRKGESDPKADNLGKIADVLGCSTDYLLGRCNDPQPSTDGYELSEDELELISYFRTLSSKGRRHVLTFAEDEVTQEVSRGGVENKLHE